MTASTYEVEVYTDHKNMEEIITTLKSAGFRIVETIGTSIYFELLEDIVEAVKVINKLGYDTDEDSLAYEE